MGADLTLFTKSFKPQWFKTELAKISTNTWKLATFTIYDLHLALAYAGIQITKV